MPQDEVIHDTAATKLRPPFPLAAPGEDVLLASGDAEFGQPDAMTRGKAKMSLRLQPGRPHVTLEVKTDSFDGTLLLGRSHPVSVLLRPWALEPLPTANIVGGSYKLIGEGPQRTKLGHFNGWFSRGDAGVECRLYLLNLRDWFQLSENKIVDNNQLSRQTEFYVGPWRVRTELLNEHFNFAESTHGHSTTHVCVIDRPEQREFTLSELKKILGYLHFVFDFAAGRQIGFAVPALVDNSDEIIAWHPADIGVDPYKKISFGWAKDLGKTDWEAYVTHLWRSWDDLNLRDALSETLYWYLLANSGRGHVSQDIVSACVGFETLFWWIASSKNLLSENGIEKLAAADGLRMCLGIAQVNQGLPMRLAALAKAAKAENWQNGPDAIYAVRNAIVHTSSKKRDLRRRMGIQAIAEAHFLACEYLELLLLYSMGYNGHYFPRTELPSPDPIRVPWAIQTDPGDTPRPIPQ